MKAYIDPEKCIGCGACIAECPEHAVIMLPGFRSEVQAAKCSGCGHCVGLCHRKVPVLCDEGIMPGHG